MTCARLGICCCGGGGGAADLVSRLRPTAPRGPRSVSTGAPGAPPKLLGEVSRVPSRGRLKHVRRTPSQASEVVRPPPKSFVHRELLDWGCFQERGKVSPLVGRVSKSLIRNSGTPVLHESGPDVPAKSFPTLKTGPRSGSGQILAERFRSQKFALMSLMRVTHRKKFIGRIICERKGRRLDEPDGSFEEARPNSEPWGRVTCVRDRGRQMQRGPATHRAHSCPRGSPTTTL